MFSPYLTNIRKAWWQNIMARKKQITVDEWVTKVSEKSGVNPNLTKAVLDTVSEIICEEVKEDKRECYIPNFGTFIRATHKGHPLNLDIEGLEKKKHQNMILLNLNQLHLIKKRLLEESKK